MRHELKGWSWTRPYGGMAYLKRDELLNGHSVWVTVEHRGTFSVVYLVHLTVYKTDPAFFTGADCAEKAKDEAIRLAINVR